MKTRPRPKALIYLFTFVLALQLLTGCSSFIRPSQELFLSDNYTFDKIPKVSQVHQKFSDKIVPNECPQWFYENYDDIIYNLEMEETVKGEVLNVDTVGNYVTIQVKTDEETIPVYLAPIWYLENRDIEIQRSDTVEVLGSLVNFNGETSIIASQITKGGVVLRLRDNNGFSLWNDKKQEEFDWFLDMFPYLCDAE